MLLKSQEEHREQMARLVKTVLPMSEGKGIAETSSPRIVREKPLNLPGFIPIHVQAPQDTCLLPYIVPPPT